MVTSLGNPAPGPEVPVLSGLDPILATPRLRLRPYVLEDVDAIWPYVSDPAFPRMMSWAAHTDREQTRAWVRSTIEGWRDGTGACWAITEGGAAMGSIGLHDVHYRMGGWRIDRAELGYWLAPQRWNQGIVTEAGAAVMRFGFATMRLHKITVSCLDGNHGSQRVIEKLGFRAVGSSRDDVFRDGRWWDHLRFELTRGEARS